MWDLQPHKIRHRADANRATFDPCKTWIIAATRLQAFTLVILEGLVSARQQPFSVPNRPSNLTSSSNTSHSLNYNFCTRISVKTLLTCRGKNYVCFGDNSISHDQPRNFKSLRLQLNRGWMTVTLTRMHDFHCNARCCASGKSANDQSSLARAICSRCSRNSRLSSSTFQGTT